MIVQLPRREISYLVVHHILDGVANDSCVGGLFQLSTLVGKSNGMFLINDFPPTFFRLSTSSA